MAEEIQTTEVTKNSISNQGMLSNISNSLEKIKKFSNEPAVQRSIPVMITLFVIFLGLTMLQPLSQSLKIHQQKHPLNCLCLQI